MGMGGETLKREVGSQSGLRRPPPRASIHSTCPLVISLLTNGTLQILVQRNLSALVSLIQGFPDHLDCALSFPPTGSQSLHSDELTGSPCLRSVGSTAGPSEWMRKRTQVKSVGQIPSPAWPPPELSSPCPVPCYTSLGWGWGDSSVYKGPAEL